MADPLPTVKSVMGFGNMCKITFRVELLWNLQRVGIRWLGALAMWMVELLNDYEFVDLFVRS